MIWVTLGSILKGLGVLKSHFLDHIFDVFSRLGFERTFGLHYDDFGIDFGVTFGTFAPSASRNLPGAARGSPGQPPEMVSEMQCGAPTLAQWPR